MVYLSIYLLAVLYCHLYTRSLDVDRRWPRRCRCKVTFACMQISWKYSRGFRNAMPYFYGPVSGFSHTNTTLLVYVVIRINPSKVVSGRKINLWRWLEWIFFFGGKVASVGNLILQWNLPVKAQKMADIFIRCREVRPHAGKVNVKFTLEQATKTQRGVKL